MRGISNFRNSLIIISITILLILGSQVYRTLNNYELNKQRFINDVQLALDLSIEKYYADKARSHFSMMTITNGDTIQERTSSSYSVIRDSLNLDTVVIRQSNNRHVIEPNKNSYQYSWSSKAEGTNVEKHIKKIESDSVKGAFLFTSINISDDSTHDLHLDFDNFQKLTQKIMISTTEETLDLGELQEILSEELDRKNLSIGYQLEYEFGSQNEIHTNEKKISEYPLNTSAKSTYLSSKEALKLHFENAPLLILKRGAWDLALSFAIVFSVIAALLYLYRVIKNQKELAMIKDDLIGNVTHEFKTPIATVTSALEAISNFNDTNDKEKTKRYLDMSRDQLTKLNLMVEKLMETATIDSGELEINKVETNLTELTMALVENFSIRSGDKTITSDLATTAVWSMVDPFHWENVLANLLDNAIKYGGNEIRVSLKQDGKQVKFQVIDNGGSIDKTQQSRVFEKLYRIPTGNQHDVKGFGIGLYYTKAVVERHGGHISLDVASGQTCFTVIL